MLVRAVQMLIEARAVVKSAHTKGGVATYRHVEPGEHVPHSRRNLTRQPDRRSLELEQPVNRRKIAG